MFLNLLAIAKLYIKENTILRAICNASKVKHVISLTKYCFLCPYQIPNKHRGESFTAMYPDELKNSFRMDEKNSQKATTLKGNFK